MKWVKVFLGYIYITLTAIIQFSLINEMSLQDCLFKVDGAANKKSSITY